MSVSEPSRLSRIIEGHGPVLGATLDGLAREIEGRIRPEERADFVTLIETWPLDAGGAPVDGGSLYKALLRLRALPARRREATSIRRTGSLGAGLLGLVLGGLGGAVVGGMVWFALSVFVMPPGLAQSEAVMWGMVWLAAVLFGGVGFYQGVWPSRLGGAIRGAYYGFFGGMIVGAIAGLVVAGTLGAIFNVSQREGAFAMGVVFGIMPLTGCVVGMVGAIWLGCRAWRRG